MTNPPLATSAVSSQPNQENFSLYLTQLPCQAAKQKLLLASAGRENIKFNPQLAVHLDQHLFPFSGLQLINVVKCKSKCRDTVLQCTTQMLHNCYLRDKSGVNCFCTWAVCTAPLSEFTCMTALEALGSTPGLPAAQCDVCQRGSF